MNKSRTETDLSLLAILTEDQGYGKEWMSKPFLVGDKVVATNAHSLIALPNHSGLSYNDETIRLKGIYPFERNCNRVIHLSALREAIVKVPVLDCYDETVTECDACAGEGEVHSSFWHGNKSFETEIECPVCNGQGEKVETSKEPNGKKELDSTAQVSIDGTTFLIARIEEIVKVCELLGEDKIRLVGYYHNQAGFCFQIGRAELVVMSCMPGTGKEVFAAVVSEEVEEETFNHYRIRKFEEKQNNHERNKT